MAESFANDYVHFPAGPSDFAALLQRLPPTVSHGLAEIVLDLRAPEPDSGAVDPADLDPWLSTTSIEFLPGVYVGETLGSYFAESSNIVLYAYLYDPANTDAKTWSIILRLHALHSFLHEVAHHFDHTQCTNPDGRAADDNSEKKEQFAERCAYDWSLEFAVPYLEQTYAIECAALRRWTMHYGGADVPLSALLSQPNGIHFAFPPFEAIANLAKEIRQNSPLNKCRLVFAEHLHFSERYEEALQSIQRVLQDESENVEALLLQADIFIHQGLYSEAIAIAEPIRQFRADYRLRKVLADAYEGLEDWARVIEVTTEALAAPQEHERDHIMFLRPRARAYIRTGKIPEATQDLESVEAYQNRRGSRLLEKQIAKLRGELKASTPPM